MTENSRSQIKEALLWALEIGADPAMAAADWLARDIEPDAASAVDLLADPKTSVESLCQAKDAFKTLRVVGETSADRRLGARLYAASIAAGIVHHRVRISRQSSGAIARALKALLDDHSMPDSLRVLSGTALTVLDGPPLGGSNGTS